MNNRHLSLDDPRVKLAVDEIKAMILSKFPDAELDVYVGEEPDGFYIDAIVDIDDPEEVMDHVIDRLVEINVENRIPLHVIPLQPLSRQRSILDASLR